MKKLYILILAVVMLFSTTVFAQGTEEGIGFSSNEMYKTTRPFSEFPLTYEAEIKLPDNYTSRGGTILGNYYNTSAEYTCFEIYSNGVPRLSAKDNSGEEIDILFDEIDVCTGNWVHVAITLDIANSRAYCYIDGQFKQEVSYSTTFENVVFVEPMVLGGDMRANNDKYFKGRIKSVSIYNDLRRAEEIALDFDSDSDEMSKDGLMGEYKLAADENGLKPTEIVDISGNDMDFILGKLWIKGDIPLDECAYSFAVVGDTQIVAAKYPEYFAGIYDWIIENQDKYNTKFVFNLGDITDNDTNAEWAIAKSLYEKMGKILPFSFVRGNHDSIGQYCSFLPYSEYGDKVCGSYDKTMLNTYQKLTVGNIKYLILNLDYCPTDEFLAWADEIVQKHEDYNVIITTHAYLWRDGTTLDINDGNLPTGSNNGEVVWNNFVKKHKNIVLVLSGHIDTDRVVTTQVVGDNGNVVTQMLINPQNLDYRYNALGMVAMLHFTDDGKKVQVRYYSTVKDAYFMSDNQYSFDINVIENEEVTAIPEIIAEKTSVDVNLNGEKNGNIIVAFYDGNGRLCNVEIYDSADEIKAVFNNNLSNSEIKVMWFEDMNTIKPVTQINKLDVFVSN